MAEYPQSYELPQTLNPASKDNGRSRNSSHNSSHSTRRLRYTLGADGRRIENWFNDSFEEGDYEEDERYATRPRLFSNMNAGTAKTKESSNTNSGDQAEEENLYDFPEDAAVRNSEEGNDEIYDDTMPVNQEDAIYECPDDITADTPGDDAHKISGEATIEIPAELYECLDNVNSNIYEAVDQEPVNIYDGTF